MQIGVYGGSFDPPHVAHVLLAAYALAVGGFDEVQIVPVFSHAFNKSLVDFEHRVALCELAFRDLKRVRVSRIEASLPTPSRTLSTLEAIARENPSASLRLLVGADVLAETSKWHAFDAIARLAPPFVVGREGHTLAQPTGFALPAVSSTRVRELSARSDDRAAAHELAELVPAPVLAYIREHRLYRTTS
jgi:nicotinate-nucleotide adenylyltransferase